MKSTGILIKRRIQSAVLVGVCSVGLVPFFATHGQEAGLYVKGDVGGTWTQDTDLKEFFGEPLAPGSKVRFKNGARVGFTAGYQFTDWFAIEGQTGVMATKIDSITGGAVDATLSNVPFLVNLRLQAPGQSGFTPYIGGGLGVAAAVLDADHINLGSTGMTGTQSDAVFAYQAFAGLRYKLNEHMGLSLEYHYFATTDPEWKADFTVGTTSDRMRFGGIETHAVSIAFEYKF
jgi:opacity protein-like surface antigen